MGKSKFECTICRKKFEEGIEILELQNVVAGINGIVTVNGPRFFCSVECLREYLNGSKTMLHMKKRIP